MNITIKFCIFKLVYSKCLIEGGVVINWGLENSSKHSKHGGRCWNKLGSYKILENLIAGAEWRKFYFIRKIEYKDTEVF